MNIKLLSLSTSYKTNNLQQNKNNAYVAQKINPLKTDSISFSSKQSFNKPEATAIVNNDKGIHTVALGMLSLIAHTYPGSITIKKDDDSFDARGDIFENIDLICEKGTKLTVSVEGDKAEDMLKKMTKFLSAKSDKAMFKLYEKYTK